MSDTKSIPPNIYDKIYWSIQDKKLKSDFFIQLSELFWPTFIQHESYVFLKELFSQEKYDELIEHNHHPEFWINLLPIDGFFDDAKEAEKALALTTILMDTWKIKLKNAFPHLEFVVELIYPVEGEHGITFYQKEADRSTSTTKSHLIIPRGEFPCPNIKETFPIQSSKANRIGKPQIRPARPEEIPKSPT